MTTHLEQLAHRLARAEQDITSTRGEIGALRRQCWRTGAIASGFALLAMFATISALSSVTTEAQGSNPLTVRAPFMVVDAANKPLLTVGAPGARGLQLLRSDGAPFAILTEEGSNIRGPLRVSDNANKSIILVQDETVTSIKDTKGVEQPVTTNRGLHVFNGKGDVVARMGVHDGDGYVGARQAGKGISPGGVIGLLFANKDGTHLTLSAATGKVAVELSSLKEGLQFKNDAGVVMTQVNRGHVWMGNAAGAGIVELAEDQVGRGMVQVGPRFGGPQGPGMLGFPYLLLGRK